MPWRTVLKGSSQGGIVVLDVANVRAHWRVQFRPRGRRPASLNNLIGAGQDRRRDGEAECLGGFQIDDQFESRRLRNGQVGGLRTLQYPSEVIAGLAKESVRVGAIADQTARDFGSFYAKFYPSINVVVPTAPRRG